MFYVKNPSELGKPWVLSRNDDENVVSIPVEVTALLKNYHIMAIEFLYHNHRKGMKGSILNQEHDMNFPLEISALFMAMITGPGLVLVICSRQTSCFWHYHLTNHANFEVIQVSSKNSTNSYEGNTCRIALLLHNDCLKLCEDFPEHDFFSVVIEDFDQIAVKRVIKRLNGSFNVGLTHRSFYTEPDQKLQWSMLNWANPGCVGKLNDFYEIDNTNFDNLTDNYRHWWMRLTWQFCESFEPPTDAEKDSYRETVKRWASDNSLSYSPKPEKKARKRKSPDVVISDSCSSNGNDVPSNKYVKLPSMDEDPIVTSIIKNFEKSPEPILTRSKMTLGQSLPYTQTQPTCSRYSDENSVILSFLKDEEKPSTSRSESEDFILNLI